MDSDSRKTHGYGNNKTETDKSREKTRTKRSGTYEIWKILIRQNWYIEKVETCIGKMNCSENDRISFFHFKIVKNCC